MRPTPKKLIWRSFASRSTFHLNVYQVYAQPVTELLTYIYRRQAAIFGDVAYLFVLFINIIKRFFPPFWSKSPTLDEKDPKAKTHDVMTLAIMLLDRINFLIDNSYVTFDGEVFKQEIGIAMGLIPAGAIASLVCYTYELDY